LIKEISQHLPRRPERRAGVIPVTLRVETDGKRYEQPTSTLNISERGLRILTGACLVPGHTIDLYTNRMLLGHCRVVWVAGGGPDRPREVGLEVLY
jgi:hypothetical protein